jgi:hypothetical protein
MNKKLLLTAIVAITIFKYGICQCTTTGIVNIGAGGNYTTITAAVNALRANGLASSVILELQANYVSTAETFPISFSGINCVGLSKTITIRPKLGATGLAITTSSQYTIDLNAASRIIIDGRPGGNGTTSELTISNTHNLGAAVLFVNNASNDTLQYLNINGAAQNGVIGSVTTYDTVGVIKFAKSQLGIGCDSNTIYRCNVFDANTATPGTLIYAEGVINKVNHFNAIVECNLYNFYQQTNNSYGILIKEYNDKWRISNNTFYQTSNRTYVLSTFTPAVFCLKLETAFYGGFEINGNTIGGSQPNAAGAMSNLTGNFVFTGIVASNAYLVNFPGNVHHNTIKNLSLSPSNNIAQHAAISLGTASANFFGDCHDNIIGSTSTNASIVFTATGNSSTFLGITGGVANINSVPTYIRYNTISGVNVNGSNSSFWGINVGGAGNMVVDSNKIGTPTLANSILNNATGYVYGIRVVNYSTNGLLSVTKNEINNLTSSSTSSSATVSGIYTEGSASGRYIIQKNIVSNLTAASPNSSATIGAVNGISLNIGGIPALNVSANKISNLFSTATSGNNYIYGIFYSGPPSSGFDTISNNIIRDFSAASSGNVNLKGIHTESGSSTLFNNVIRLGVKEDGSSVGGNYTITGISEALVSNKVIHNSIYIGGNTANATNNSYAFSTLSNTSARVLSNNIFYNARSNASGIGKNYAIDIAGANASPIIITLNNNLYFANGTNGFLGRFNATNYNILAAWVSDLQNDNNSKFGNPNFENILGSSAAFNYHLTGVTLAESNGTTANTTLLDVDGETRASLTPVDIGADAGLYSPLVIDTIPPSINYFPVLPNAINTNNRILTANISDAVSGVDTLANLKPKIWFKRKSGVTSSGWASAAGIFMSGTINAGVYNFTLDYNLLSGTTQATDTILYYVVAQDKATPSNIASIPFAQHSSVNIQIAEPTLPNQYIIVPQIVGDILVGTGQQFTSLTKAGGLFKFINTWKLAGNINIKISSDLNETGENYLYGVNLNNYEVKIMPATAGIKTITNSIDLSNPLISIWQTTSPFSIDGSFNGTGKNLKFICASTVNNSNSFLTALSIFFNTSSVSLKNCIWQSNNTYTASGTVNLNTNSMGTVFFENNVVENISTHPLATGSPKNGLFINSGGNLLMKNNEIINALGTLVKIEGSLDSCLFQSNHLYNTLPLGSSALLDIYGGRKFIVKDNYFGGTATFCGGSPFIAAGIFSALHIYENPSNNIDMDISIQNNIIQNFNVPLTLPNSNANSNFYGIYFNRVSSIKIGNEVKNIIGSLTLNNSININNQSATQNIYGIGYLGSKQVIIENNEIGGFNANMAVEYRSLVGGIVSPSLSTVSPPQISSVSIKNNIIKNFAINYQAWSGTIPSGHTNLAGITIGNNEAVGLVDIVGNKIGNLSTKGLTNYNAVLGIFIPQTMQNNNTLIQKNRIYGLTNESLLGNIYGINLENTSNAVSVYNNQIALTNASFTNPIKLYGIYANVNQLFPNQTKSLYYNSIYLAGNASNTDSSAAMRIVNEGGYPNPSVITGLKNNLLFNKRTSAFGKHTAFDVIGNNVNSFLAANISDNNLFVVTDTNKVASWQTEAGLKVAAFKAVSSGDQNSYATLTTNLPENLFFKNVDTANLNLINTNDICWYANGKGMPIIDIPNDYDNNIRNTLIANGATDIGANEFTTSTLPPVLQVFGRHNPGGADTLVWAGKRVAIINWASTGTLPTLGALRWFTGTWPNDTTNNGTIIGARYMNSYLQVPATGGSNYKYSLSINYNKSMLGKIIFPSSMIINKREINQNGSWRKVIPTVLDTFAKTLIIHNQNSFSEFTATDADAALSKIILVDNPVIDKIITTSANPTNGLYTINFNTPTNETISITIFDTNGKFIDGITNNNVIGNYSKTFDLYSQANGMYYIKIIVGSNTQVSKLVLMH